MPQTSNGTINPLSTVSASAPDFRGGINDPGGIEFTLAANSSFTTPQLDVDCFPATFVVVATNTVNAGNQSFAGLVYFNSSTSTPLIQSANGIVASGTTADTLVVTRTNRSLVFTLPTGSSAVRVRIARFI